jgi:hypothetical protein
MFYAEIRKSKDHLIMQGIYELNIISEDNDSYYVDADYSEIITEVNKNNIGKVKTIKTSLNTIYFTYIKTKEEANNFLKQYNI